MDQLYTDYLQIIREVCTNSEKRHVFHGEKLKDLYRLSSEHFTVPFLLPYTAPSDKLFFQIRQQTKMMMLHYYQIEQFTVRLTSLLKEHHIPCILLKGISLAAYYPTPELRKLGDVDLYISDPDDLDKAKQILERNDFPCG